MIAEERALAYLETHTAFSRHFDRLSQRGGWARRWLTATQITIELGEQGFWQGKRRAVLPEARAKLVGRHLDKLVDRVAPSDGSSLAAAAEHLPGTGQWKRFDGQYKRNPQTRLVGYRAKEMARSFDRRAFERVKVRGVRCQYGPVLDMSTMGLHFRCEAMRHFEIGSKGYLRISHAGGSLRLRVKVVWLGPAIDLGREIGVEFRRPDDEARKTIAEILGSAGEGD